MKIHSLKFESVDFAFEGQDPVFEAVDFDFPMNTWVWVKASSGSGRSTLLQILAGLQMPTKGRYLINDENVTDMSFEEFLPYRLQIGYGFDFGGLINNRTLLENVTLPLVYHKQCSLEEANERASELFEKLNATRFMGQRPALVPGGIRKLTCLIRAVITRPQILLLDDPSVGLGQDTILKFFDVIEGLRKQGYLQHIFMSSFDDKLMGLLPHTEIFIDGGLIHKEIETEEKKAVSL